MCVVKDSSSGRKAKRGANTVSLHWLQPRSLLWAQCNSLDNALLSYRPPKLYHKCPRRTAAPLPDAYSPTHPLLSHFSPFLLTPTTPTFRTNLFFVPHLSCSLFRWKTEYQLERRVSEQGRQAALSVLTRGLGFPWCSLLSALAKPNLCCIYFLLSFFKRNTYLQGCSVWNISRVLARNTQLCRGEQK